MYNTAESWLPNMIQSRDIEFTLSTFNALYEFVNSFKHDDIQKFCILVSDEELW